MKCPFIPPFKIYYDKSAKRTSVIFDVVDSNKSPWTDKEHSLWLSVDNFTQAKWIVAALNAFSKKENKKHNKA